MSASQTFSAGNPAPAHNVTPTGNTGGPLGVFAFHRHEPSVYDPAVEGARLSLDLAIEGRISSTAGTPQHLPFGIGQNGIADASIFLGPSSPWPPSQTLRSPVRLHWISSARMSGEACRLHSGLSGPALLWIHDGNAPRDDSRIRSRNSQAGTQAAGILRGEVEVNRPGAWSRGARRLLPLRDELVRRISSSFPTT